jgi:hypothetical protein
MRRKMENDTGSDTRIAQFDLQWGARNDRDALGTDLKRDDEDFIVDDSDLGIAIREMERIIWQLSKLSFTLWTKGIEAAPPEPLESPGED